MATRLRGRWALGITPRNFTWILKDKLAICERPGGYGDNHRRVRRQEEIIWIRENGFGCVISIIPAPHNLHNYDELGVTYRHRPFNADELDPWLQGASTASCTSCCKAGTKVLVHGEEVGDRIVGIMGGYIRWAGLVDDDTRRSPITERIAGRQLDPFARNVILNATRCADPPRRRRLLASACDRGLARLSGYRWQWPGKRVLVQRDGRRSRLARRRPARSRAVGRRAARHRRRPAAAAAAPRRVPPGLARASTTASSSWSPRSTPTSSCTSRSGSRSAGRRRARPASLTDEAATRSSARPPSAGRSSRSSCAAASRSTGGPAARRPAPTSRPPSTRRATSAACSPTIEQTADDDRPAGRRAGRRGAPRAGARAARAEPARPLLRMPAVPFSVLADPPFAVVEDVEAARAFVAAARRRLDEPVNVVGQRRDHRLPGDPPRPPRPDPARRPGVARRPA